MIPFLPPEKATKDPVLLFLAFYLSPIISLFISYIIFPSDASLPFIFLTLLCSFPYTFFVFEREVGIVGLFFERLDFEDARKNLEKIFNKMLIYFFSNFLSFLSIFLLLPENLREFFFEYHLSIIPLIRGRFPGGDLIDIIVNNFSVLAATFLISLIYLTGSSFVVLWNSSLLACIIGEIIVKEGLSLRIIGYLMHGIPEIIAYILSGISGSIIALAISKEYEDYIKERLLKVSIDLLILASLLLLFSAGIEVSISPLLLK